MKKTFRFCSHLIKKKKLHIASSTKRISVIPLRELDVEFSPQHVQSASDIFALAWINALRNQ